MLDNPDWAPIFAPTGRFLRRGEKIRRPNYAKTLRTIAENGPEAFYTVRIFFFVYQATDRTRAQLRIIFLRKSEPQGES